ncbi:hypothetical protein AX17_006373 [Amanita inopinata Kibby_2008]|nr:hypothetical protein AX17_006373 [Amanita inopinata Kibby_2008]
MAAPPPTGGGALPTTGPIILPPTTTSTTSTSTTSTTTTTTSTTPTITQPTTTSIPQPTTSTGVPTTSTSATSTTSSLPNTSLSTNTLTATSTSANGGVVTITSTRTTSNIPTLGPSTTNVPSSSRGFFHNTGAVAGVFTVVGLIVVAILIAFVVNYVRRRRAEKFDREIAEAAAEAAAARAPAFLDDDAENYGPSGGYGSYPGKFSDISHGTYSQSPMGVNPESYNMREMGPGPGEVYDANGYGAAGVGAGAAGIGVARARSRRDGGFAAGLQDGASPYVAFAGPHHHDMRNSPRPTPDFRGPGSPEFDLLEAAGMGQGTSDVQRGPSQRTQYTQQTDYSNLSRNKSQGGASSEEYAPSHSRSFSPPYQSMMPPTALRPGVHPTSSVQNNGNEVAYGEREENVNPGDLPNPFAASDAHDHQVEDHAEESSDEEEPPRRVLRVANE